MIIIFILMNIITLCRRISILVHHTIIIIILHIHYHLYYTRRYAHTKKEAVLHQMPRQCVRSSPVRRRWFFDKRSTWSLGTALGYCSSCVALIRRGDSSLFVAAPEVNSSALSPDRNIQPSGRTSSNESAPRAFIVASAKDGKYCEVASLHVPIVEVIALSKSGRWNLMYTGTACRASHGCLRWTFSLIVYLLYNYVIACI